MSQPLIYLDYASTHPRKQEIIKAREEWELHSYANIGRGNYDLAEKAMVAYQQSKKAVARWIGCDPVEVIYTYSATYALNILALAIEQNAVIGKGDTILLSISEHHANIVPWQMLAERVGAQIKFVTLDENYCINLDDLSSKLDETVKIVSLQYASNVTGAVHPLEKIRDIIGRDRLFCVDATQMGLHGPISMHDLQCDAMVFSGHKMMADTGIGVLALWKMLQKSWQSPLGWGGAINFVSTDGYEQSGIPDRWEPGTPHITGSFTLTAAIEYLEKMEENKRKKYRENIYFINDAFEKIKEKWVTVFHSYEDNALGIWSFTLEGKHATDIADIFGESNICVRAGHHCCEPLHTYLGISGSVRMSIGFDTTRDEIDKFFHVLESFL